MAKDKNTPNKPLYDYMFDIHKHIYEQQKYAEAKNNILLAILLAVSAVYARLFVAMQDTLTNNTCSLILFCIPIIPLFIALCKILNSFKPNTSNIENANIKDKKQTILIQPNIYFFKYICTIKSDDLIQEIKNKANCVDISNEKQIKDLANQICILSNITTQKHKCFNKTMCWVKCFIYLSMGIFLLYILLNTNFR